MEGEYISTEETLLRTKAKDFIAFNGVKTVNLLNLFIFAEVDKVSCSEKGFQRQLGYKMVSGYQKHCRPGRHCRPPAGLAGDICPDGTKTRDRKKNSSAGWQKKVVQLRELADNSNQIQQAAEEIDGLAREQ